MDNRLSDVHTIASELMHREKIEQDNTPMEGSRIVRVERQPAARGPAIAPAAMPPGLTEEMRRLNGNIEAIRRSVEFTEAHVAINRGQTEVPCGADDKATASYRHGLTVPLLIIGNLILSAMLLVEIHDDRVGTTVFTLSRAFARMLTG